MTTSKQYKDFTQEVLLRTDIIDIIGKRINLRKTGANYTALCPFHDEKTPSFLVSPNKQFYHCFGCGASGNAISFIMAFDKLNFIEALEFLASSHGLTLPTNNNSNYNSQKTSQFQDIYSLLNQVNKFYIEQLHKSDKAKNYLSQRGLSPNICQRFGIGFSPAGWDNLTHFFYKNITNKEHLLTSGMLIRKDKSVSVYSRFRNRLMFPIRNKQGNIIAYGGRTLDDEIPKYLNSPETTLFHKGNELYGLYELRQNHENHDYIIVVEGYMDVIALAQHQINNVVATLGTAITSKQILQLTQLYSKIIFCFDGDQAGQKALWRALENALPILSENILLYFLILPSKHDPDSFIRENGKDFFIQMITNAKPCSDFLFQRLLNNNNMQTTEGKAKFISEAQNLFHKIPNGVFKQVLLQQLSSISKIDITNLQQNPNSRNNYANNANANYTQSNNTQYNTPYTNNKYSNAKYSSKNKTNHINNLADFALHKNTVIMNPFHQAINYLFTYPKLINAIDNNWLMYLKNLKTKDAELLQQLIKLLQLKFNNNQTTNTDQEIKLGQIIEFWRDKDEFKLIMQLASYTPLVDTNENDLTAEFNAILNVLRKQSIDQAIQNILSLAKTRELNAEEKIKLQELIKLNK